uniref:Uncharacterized protein n=1 Tax=Janibacter limosus TaxID=53458 RepID=A0AC61U7A9_9MICO
MHTVRHPCADLDRGFTEHSDPHLLAGVVDEEVIVLVAAHRDVRADRLLDKVEQGVTGAGVGIARAGPPRPVQTQHTRPGGAGTTGPMRQQLRVWDRALVAEPRHRSGHERRPASVTFVEVVTTDGEHQDVPHEELDRRQVVELTLTTDLEDEALPLDLHGVDEGQQAVLEGPPLPIDLGNPRRHLVLSHHHLSPPSSLTLYPR